MKKFIIFCFLLAAYAAVNAWSPVAWLRTQSEIDLKEIIAVPSPKSPSICESVKVVQQASGITVSFNANLGNLIVEVVDSAGDVVFQQKVNATAGSNLPIDTQDWESGTYTIRILNEQGNGCEGCFEI